MPARKGAGRPSSYTDELADTICLRLMEGESLKAICASDGMPARSTVLLWVINNKVFAEKYELARRVQDEVDFDDIRDIADTALEGTKTVTKGDKTERIVGDNVERSKLKVHARQWILARRNPRKYGEKVHQEHTGADGGPIKVDNVSLTDAERLAAIAAVFDTARARAAGPTAATAQDVGASGGSTD